MQGQWQGEVGQGEFVNVEIDDYGDFYQGRIYLYHDGLEAVVVASFFGESGKPIDRHEVTLEYQHISSTNRIPVQELCQAFPQQRWPEKAFITLSLIDGDLQIEASAEDQNGQKGSTKILVPASQSAEASQLAPDTDVGNWDSFKEMVGKIPLDKHIFRGQPVQKRLRTSFHRSGRKDLFRYVNFDVPKLHRAITTSVSQYFDLSDNNHYAAFLNLLQHHGYPTPLLDWSHSPYVAAYFAFRHWRESPKADDKVRIFMFDAQQWRSDFDQLYSLLNVRPHFSLLEPLALENPRAAPQQALSAVATVDDIEGYLDKCGRLRGRDYLRVFDLPYSERAYVLKELRLMGITAASLFPGFDGVCEAMRIQHFER